MPEGLVGGLLTQSPNGLQQLAPALLLPALDLGEFAQRHLGAQPFRFGMGCRVVGSSMLSVGANLGTIGALSLLVHPSIDVF